MLRCIRNRRGDVPTSETRSFLVPRLTYANVIATLALFISLGGASYAAVSLRPNSVGSRQIQNGAVILPKLGFALGSSSAQVAGPQTIRGFSCGGSVTGAAPPCPPPPSTALASTSIRLSRRANILVLASTVISEASASPAGTSVQLHVDVDNGRFSSPGAPYSVTALAPGEDASAFLIAMVPGVPAGRHAVHVIAVDDGPSVVASGTQVSAVALPR